MALLRWRAPERVSRGLVVGSPVGVHVHDNPAVVSSLNLLPFFTTQPFQTGVDASCRPPPAGRNDHVLERTPRRRVEDARCWTRRTGQGEVCSGHARPGERETLPLPGRSTSTG